MKLSAPIPRLKSQARSLSRSEGIALQGAMPPGRNILAELARLGPLLVDARHELPVELDVVGFELEDVAEGGMAMYVSIVGMPVVWWAVDKSPHGMVAQERVLPVSNVTCIVLYALGTDLSSP